MEHIRIIVSRVDVDRWEQQEREMVPHSTIDTCRTCHEPVWLSPEGNKFVYDSDQVVEVICTDCHIQLEVERRKRGDEDDIKIGLVPGATIPVPRDVKALVAAFERAIRQAVKERE